MARPYEKVSILIRSLKENFKASDNNFNAHFGIIWSNVIKEVLKCRFIYNYDVKSINLNIFAINTWDQTYIYVFFIIPV